MKQLQRAATLVSLVESLRENKSWCGETTIQKASFFLQELTEVPLEFEFVLYKYGPYSFELTDELTALRADSILALEVPDPSYGPSYFPGGMSGFVLERFPKTVNRCKEQVQFVAERLGSKGVAELERLATALYVRLRDKEKSGVTARANEIVRLKPHIRKPDAELAVREIDKMWDEAQQRVGE